MMQFRLTLLTLLLASAVVAQTPLQVQFNQLPRPATPTERAACADQDAGTLQLDNFTGQSNQNNGGTVTYLCLGDGFDIDHNADSDLTGDPNPATAPGIAYVFYDAEPNIGGPDLATVLTDPAIDDTNPIVANGTTVPFQGIWIFRDLINGDPSGDVSIVNTGNVQNSFDGGNPVDFWYAPITVDDFFAPPLDLTPWEDDGAGGPEGPCVSVSTDEAFRVVYLNAIEGTNVNTNTGLVGCAGSFEVGGGLPEFDGSTYTITIVNQDDPSTFGTILSGSATDGSTVDFEVPTAGMYEVSVEDGRSCGASFTVDMTGCNAVTVSAGSVAAVPGSNVCVPFTVENFTDIAGMQFIVEYDPTVVTFTGTQNFNPNANNLDGASFNETSPGTIVFLWTDFTAAGSTLPDGAVFFEMCFDVIGNLGDQSPVDITGTQITPAQASDVDGNEVPLNVNDGLIVVSNSTLLAQVVGTDPTCANDTDGSFQITISGGTPPYEFAFSEAGSGASGGPIVIGVDGGSFTVSGLVAGTYDITVVDDANAITSAQVVLTDPPTLGSNITFAAQTCPGDPIASATVTPLLDNVPVSNPGDYTYVWSTGDMTQTITDIDPSLVYSVTITSPEGCTVIDNENPVATPPIMLTNVVTDNATCSGSEDGTLMFQVSGGTPNGGSYQIEISGFPNPFNAPGFNSSTLNPGLYDITITDANGCSFTTSEAVPADKLIVLDETIDNILCAGDANGSIEVNVSTVGLPADTPYTFNWLGSPPPPTPTNTLTTTSLDNLPVGSYTLIVTDTEGCQETEMYQITAPDTLMVDSLEVGQASCVPGMDGFATVEASGGVYPYSYVWALNNDTLVGQTDSTLVNASSGVYTVFITDANGCTDSTQISIPSPLPPQVTSLDPDQLDCFDDADGTLTVTAIDGAAPITSYAWSTGDNTPTIGGLSPGTYFVTIQDANGCATVDSGLVLSPPPLVLDSLVAQAPSCIDTEDGSLAVFVSGGTGPYTYFWSTDPTNGSSFNLLPSLGVGDYTVTVVDANGCAPLNASGTVPAPPTIVISFDPTSVDSVSCANAAGVPCDGGAAASAVYSDGTAGQFTFTWESGETDFTTDNSTAAQLCEGFQTLTVADNLCISTDSVFIPAPLPITPVELTNDRVSCNGDTDGVLEIGATGGSPGFTYQWTDGPTGSLRTDLAPGNYTVIIQDSKNCVFQYQATVDEPAPFELTVNESATFDVTCFDEMDGIVTVAATGGNTDIGDVSYNWLEGVAPSTSNFAEGLGAGTYTVVATDVAGCMDTVSTTLEEPDPIDFVLAQVDPILCFGNRTTIGFDDVFGGNGGPYLFSVNNSPPTETVFGVDVFGGEQVITVFDIRGCTSSDTIQVDQPAELIVELPLEIEVELGDSTTLVPTITNETPINLDSVFWTPLEQLSFGNNTLRPSVRPVRDQEYTLTVFDENGCPGEASVFVRVDRNRNVFIPNAFSPDGNGTNERFRVFTGPGVRSIDYIRVFDRWGELVWEGTDLDPNPNGTAGWDGLFRGQLMKPGVFVYLVSVTFEDDENLIYRGDVSLLR